jgi:hypothetical protein
MEKEFIPYQQALALKELGFDESCFGWYVGLGDSKEDPFKLVQIQSEKGQFEWTDNVYHAPTFSQAFRFFRKKYDLYSYIEGAYPWFRFYINSENDRYEGYKHLLFEEAELECLKKLIEIVKEK